MRITFLIAGIICLALGILGIFLPLLPTTPFILLAAFLFARSSKRMHQWLLDNKHFGPSIRQWETNRSIAPKVKKRAMLMIVITFAITITFFIPSTELRLGLTALALVLLLFLARLKTTTTELIVQQSFSTDSNQHKPDSAKQQDD